MNGSRALLVGTGGLMLCLAVGLVVVDFKRLRTVEHHGQDSLLPRIYEHLQYRNLKLLLLAHTLVAIALIFAGFGVCLVVLNQKVYFDTVLPLGLSTYDGFSSVRWVGIYDPRSLCPVV